LACDAFHADAITMTRLYCFAFLEHATRRIHVLGVTASPTAGCVAQQARNLMLDLGDQACDLHFLIRDRDSKFTGPFDEVFKAEGIRVVQCSAGTPDERDHGTVGGQRTPRTPRPDPHHGHRASSQGPHRVQGPLNTHRPHRALNQASPLRALPDPVEADIKVTRRDRLGGLLHEYTQVA
jgi:putative transposase